MTQGSSSASESDPARLTSQALASELESQIVTGGRFPGERLVEDVLMEEFGAKRYAVRQALQHLQQQGLVDRRPNAGAFVRSYTQQEVRDLYDLRELLESACAEMISMPVAAEDLEELRKAQRRHDEAVMREDLRETVMTNIAFHQRLFSLSPNAALVDAVNYYGGVSYAMRSVGFMSQESVQRSRDEHWQMIDAIEHSNTARLVQLCLAHLRPSREAYLEFTARRSQP